ncbi:MAG: primosomal protein N', partial [Firmicutes bacterium]|nr:primosomal protein N' [Bacillota bacterium]
GVTGSGKTEIYLQLMADALAAGGQALMLVPEIALTPQMQERFGQRFGAQVAVWHSGLTDKQRNATWHNVRRQTVRIVVGVRSAVFLPFRQLRLIVIDEEHEGSYKQEEHPRYHTREVAQWRMQREGGLLVLGSATPSIETAHRARQGEIGWIRLSHRVNEQALPPIVIADMREELALGNRSMFSRALGTAIDGSLQRKEQVLLFLNRRGYASFVLCRDCGQAVECPHCAVAMTYHQETEQLTCHYCFHTQPVPQTCPACGSNRIRYFGAGTEKVVQEVQKLWPQARVMRADRDTLTSRDSYHELYQHMRDEQIDVLVGTQMIAKGLDFPKVTTVGIVAADTALHLPDFRAAERTFQLLVQASGRAGRGKWPGTVIIQTYDPEHFAVATAQSHDFNAFYHQEIGQREALNYPPFGRLWLVEVRHENLETAREMGETARTILCQTLPKDVEIRGPAPAPLAKVRNYF